MKTHYTLFHSSPVGKNVRTTVEECRRVRGSGSVNTSYGPKGLLIRKFEFLT